MIFIWSNDGGPLQHAGLCLFALQFLLPQIMNVYNITMEIQYQHQIPLAAVSLAFMVVVALTVGAVWMFAFHGNDDDDGGGDVTNNNNNATDTAAHHEHAPLGSAANPVVVDDDDDDPNDATNNNNSTRNINTNNYNAEFWERNDGITPLLDWANNSARRILHNLSPMYLMIAAGFILPLSMIIPIFMDGGAAALLNDGNNNTLQLSMFAFLAHSFMAVGAYRLLRQVLNNQDVGTYPGMRQGGGRGGRRRTGSGRRYTVGDVEGMVRKVPVEEFVSEEELKAGACSISKMKRMLVNRGASDSLHRCLDRSDLLEEIEKVRKYNEDCTICAEQYEEGDALRVLKCQHEFHLHCFDRWVYTFATDSRRGNNKPSCPLCKTELCE